MNAFRVKFSGTSNRALLVQSTFDKSYFLNPKEDEQVQFDKNALVILKNTSEEDVVAKFTGTKMDRPGSGIVFRSNRRANFMLSAGDSIKIRMQAGEVLQIRGEDAMDRRECPTVAGLTSV